MIAKPVAPGDVAHGADPARGEILGPYVLADNKLALNAGWDPDILAIELQALIDLDFDVALTGFSTAEIDLTLDAARELDPDAPDLAEDAIPPPWARRRSAERARSGGLAATG